MHLNKESSFFWFCDRVVNIPGGQSDQACDIDFPSPELSSNNHTD